MLAQHRKQVLEVIAQGVLPRAEWQHAVVVVYLSGILVANFVPIRGQNGARGRQDALCLVHQPRKMRLLLCVHAQPAIALCEPLHLHGRAEEMLDAVLARLEDASVDPRGQRDRRGTRRPRGSRRTRQRCR